LFLSQVKNLGSTCFILCLGGVYIKHKIRVLFFAYREYLSSTMNLGCYVSSRLFLNNGGLFIYKTIRTSD